MADSSLGGELGGFADHLARRANTPGTVRCYLSILRAFHGWLGRPLNTATGADIDRWLASRPLGPRARYTYISCLASFYQWELREGRVEVDPTAKVERPRLPRPVPRPMSTADFQTALAHADPRMRAWLALAGYAGLRCQEIAGLTVDDLLFGYDPPLIVVRAGKGRKQRVVAMHDYVQMALRDAGIPRTGPLFPRRDRPRQRIAVSAHYVSATAARYLHGLGIPATLHQARHLFATALYRTSHDIRLVQEALGHSSILTTSGYVQYGSDVAAEAIRSLSLDEGTVSDSADIPRAGDAAPGGAGDDVGGPRVERT